MLLNRTRALFHPERYHGWGRTKKYFEGWYYKVVSAGEDAAFAFIPGIAMDENGRKHAFVQVLDGKKQSAEYIRYSADEFTSKANKFETRIAGNIFTLKTMTLDLEKVRGELQMKNPVPWPNTWYSPGIMGPYSFVPFMECYHGILSMDHELEGSLNIKGKEIDFTGGRGYAEKDWGHSFPSAYIWMQSNHFSRSQISFKASVAKIPWLRSSFVGFIAGLYFDGQLIQFTTYNAGKLTRSFADKKKVELKMENRKYLLNVHAHRNEATVLASPVGGFMDGRISESMTCRLEIELREKKGRKIFFQDTGRNAAVEVAGKINEILF